MSHGIESLVVKRGGVTRRGVRECVRCGRWFFVGICINPAVAGKPRFFAYNHDTGGYTFGAMTVLDLNTIYYVNVYRDEPGGNLDVDVFTGDWSPRGVFVCSSDLAGIDTGGFRYHYAISSGQGATADAITGMTNWNRLYKGSYRKVVGVGV